MQLVHRLDRQTAPSNRRLVWRITTSGDPQAGQVAIGSVGDRDGGDAVEGDAEAVGCPGT